MTKATDYRPYRKVLRMVQELHLRGYQLLRIAPGMSASGLHWRCTVTPASNILWLHGARTRDFDDLTAHYSTGQDREFFGWNDAAHVTPSRMAELFIERFSEIARAGRGSDWLYAGWYVEMLHLTYPDAFPIAYADYYEADGFLPCTGGNSDVKVPMPPPGLAGRDSRGAAV